MAEMTYQVGGSLKVNAPTYVTRRADRELYAGLAAGEFCYVLNCRQMGKSSLRVRTMQRLQGEGVACAAIDLTRLGSQQQTPERWYAGLVAAIARSLQLGREFDLRGWLRSQESLSGVQIFARFLDDVLLAQIPDRKIVVFFDEIDSLLSLDFASDDFFALIRSCYNQRVDDPRYDRLVFALLGVATPSDLVRDKSRTPFNLGRSVDLGGFRVEEAVGLAKGLEGRAGEPGAVLEEILAWSGGQPFLTQKLLRLVCEQGDSLAQTTNASDSRAWVAGLVSAQVVEHWETKDEPEHLKTIRDRLLRNEQHAGALLGLYQRVLESNDGIPLDDSDVQMELRLTGLVSVREAGLAVANRIYAGVFDADWVERQLDALRPYAEAFSAWNASQRVDASRLLRGRALQDAMAWAEGKRLGDDDYQFLSASQELGKREAELSLEGERRKKEAAEEARRILEGAHLRARRTVRRGVFVLVALSAVAVGFLVLAATLFRQAEAQKRRATVIELDALVRRSGVLFDDGKRLDALVEALKAGNLLLADPRLTDDAATPTRIETALLQALGWGAEVNRLSGHAGDVWDLGFGPGGDFLVTASEDDTVKLWSPNGEERATLAGHRDAVSRISLSPDGELLATASDDGTVKLWTLSGTELRSLEGHRGPVWDVSFSPDGRLLASAGEDRTVRLWRSDGTHVRTLEAEVALFDADFSPDGQLLALAGDDGAVALRSLEGADLGTLKGHRGRVWDVAFSPDGRLLASAGEDGSIKLWRLEDRTELRSLEGHEAAVRDVAFGRDGVTLASAGQDGSVRLWDLHGAQLDVFRGHDGAVWQINFAPDGRTLVSAGADHSVRFWSRDNPYAKSLTSAGPRMAAVAVSPDGARVAAASEDHSVRLWNADGSEPRAFHGHAAPVRAVAFSPEGGILASGAEDATVRLWSPEGAELRVLRGHGDIVWGVAWSPDGELISSASEDGTVRLWSREGILLHTLQGHEGWVVAVAFSPDGELLASGGKDRSVRLWSREGEARGILRGHGDGVWDVAFSPDGARIASASEDGSVKLWSRDGALLRTLEGHTDWVVGVAFSPDGKWLASASRDKTVRLWSREGEPLRTLTGFGDDVWGLTFAPDGRWLATADLAGAVVLWQLDRQWSLEALMTQGCARVGSYLEYNEAVAESDRALCVGYTAAERREREESGE